jgi:predicted GIY-YIG superfamily endonuclease
MDQLYVLQLENGKYYVGKTKNVAERYKQHIAGTGSTWTRTFKPVKLLETRSLKNQHDETNLTKDLMKKYGVDNVRGGAYTTVSLDNATKSVLERELRSSTDACFKCGEKGHFASKCPDKAELEVVWKREEKDESEVEYETDIWECSHCPKQFTSYKAAERHENACGGQSYSACYRCGRTSHYANNCYAKSHVDGYELDSDNESDDESEDDY